MSRIKEALEQAKIDQRQQAFVQKQTAKEQRQNQIKDRQEAWRQFNQTVVNQTAQVNLYTEKTKINELLGEIAQEVKGKRTNNKSIYQKYNGHYYDTSLDVYRSPTEQQSIPKDFSLRYNFEIQWDFETGIYDRGLHYKKAPPIPPWSSAEGFVRSHSYLNVFVDSNGTVAINEKQIPEQDWTENPDIIEQQLIAAVLHPRIQKDWPNSHGPDYSNSQF